MTEMLVKSLRIHGSNCGSCHDDNGVKCAYRDEKLCNETMCNDAAEEIERLRADRDEWKRRAEAAERKRGYWREWRDEAATRKGGFRKIRYYSCSECECCIAVKSNYCPQCGAKMDQYAVEV